jgi:hypothetical protein
MTQNCQNCPGVKLRVNVPVLRNSRFFKIIITVFCRYFQESLDVLDGLKGYVEELVYELQQVSLLNK